MMRAPRRPPRRGRPAGVAGFALLALALAITSCGPASQGPAGAPPSTSASAIPDLSTAQAYADAFLSATRTGFTDTALFYAPNVHQDLEFVADFVGTGRATVVQGARDSQQLPPRAMGGYDQSDAHSEATRIEPVFIDHDELLDVWAIPSCGFTVVERVTPTAQGITQESMAGSLARAETLHSGYQAIAEPLATRYVAAWASGDAATVGALYAPGAALDDSLLQVKARGRTTISALAQADPTLGGLATPRLQAPGPAIYLRGGFVVNGPFTSRIDGMVLLLDVGGEPCGDAVAVVLDLDAEGVITAERRFHRIDRLGTCGAPPVPAQGWWHSVSLPAAPWVLRTGTLPVEGGASDGIAVWNGDPGVTPLISWARQRFADAGLPPPTPSSVTFLPDVPGDRWDTYGFLTGSDATDIGVPVTAEEACTGDPCQWSIEARAAMLHELAHVWIQATPYYVRPTTKALGPRALSFVEHHDLVWYDPTLPWGQRGTERAAETLTWGLMDQPYTVDARLGPLTCAELAEDFTMLTSSSPDPRSCAETAGGAGASP